MVGETAHAMHIVAYLAFWKQTIRILDQADMDYIQGVAQKWCQVAVLLHGISLVESQTELVWGYQAT